MTPTAASDPRPRRGYLDSRWGQVHYLLHAPAEAASAGAEPRPLLCCLHATAYAGRSFGPLLPRLGRHRAVVALDTPGYGASDAPAERPTFTAYAEVIADALAQLGGGRPVDVFGYHTGALLATEIAARSPPLVRRLVLIGVPFFEGEAHARWRARLVHAAPSGERLADFQPRWDYFVTQRPAGVPLARGIANFVDELAVHPRAAWAHEALFDSDAADRLPLVRQPVLVINPSSPLADASTAAAARMPDARVVALPALGPSIFELGTPSLASTMEPFLDAAAP